MSQNIISAKNGRANKAQWFPERLFQILSTSEHEHIISWLPHGKAWRVLDEIKFEEEVIPLYFRHSKFQSFLRQVTGWGFRRVKNGSEKNSYYHEKFLRGELQLCREIERPTAGRRKKFLHLQELRTEAHNGGVSKFPIKLVNNHNMNLHSMSHYPQMEPSHNHQLNSSLSMTRSSRKSLEDNMDRAYFSKEVEIIHVQIQILSKDLALVLESENDLGSFPLLSRCKQSIENNLNILEGKRAYLYSKMNALV